MATPTGCTLIYEPKGRAREYAPLALNPYKGCDHRCQFCYVPTSPWVVREKFGSPEVRGGGNGDDFLRKLAREADKFQAAGITTQVTLSFTCDPYQVLDVEHEVTRKAIKILHRYGLPVAVLTKGGSRALRDLDLFGPRDAFASTLTLLDDDRSKEWEPGAALPADRLQTLRRFHDAGIPTWVSLEPVLDPETAKGIVYLAHDYVDVFKVGRLNYINTLPEHLRWQVAGIDWRKFRAEIVSVLEECGYVREMEPDRLASANAVDRRYYIKRDLENC